MVYRVIMRDHRDRWMLVMDSNDFKGDPCSTAFATASEANDLVEGLRLDPEFADAELGVLECAGHRAHSRGDDDGDE